MQRDSLAALDLDHCMDANGAWSAWALDLVDEAQSYTEITPSSEGLRILGVVTGPLPDMHFQLPRGSNNGEKVECFHHTAQFITLSRKPFLSEMPLADITPIVARLAQERAAKATGTAGNGAGEPIPLTPLPQDIRELIVHGSAAGHALREPDEGDRLAAACRLCPCRHRGDAARLSCRHRRTLLRAGQGRPASPGAALHRQDRRRRGRQAEAAAAVAERFGLARAQHAGLDAAAAAVSADEERHSRPAHRRA